MRQSEIDLFFSTLDRELNQPAEVILTGAVAGALLGHVRPSLGIDFEIRLKGKGGPKIQNELERAIQHVSSRLGIACQYSSCVGRWSMIHYLDYRKSAKLYKRFGRLMVKVMAAGHWTIGKMTRYLALDADDMIHVIKRSKLKPRPLIRLWARALRSSPLSIECGQFRDHVIHFLRKYAKRVWGRTIEPGPLVQYFRKSAKIPD